MSNAPTCPRLPAYYAVTVHIASVVYECTIVFKWCSNVYVTKQSLFRSFLFYFISSHFCSFVYHRITNVIKFIMNETRKPSCRWQTLATRKKVNGDHTPAERRCGAYLPHIGLWARRWIDHWVCDAWPVRCKINGYLPSRRTSPPLGRYQIILLGDRHMGVSNLLGVATQQCTGRESNLRPLDHKSNSLPLQYRAAVRILS